MRRVLLLAAVLVVTTGVARADVFFKTPSGNIGCAYDNVVGGRLVCMIYEPKVVAAILTSEGVDASGPPETWDRSWVAPGVPVLAYGKSKKVGAFTCVSERSGLTCKGKAHGFTMSRAGIKTH